MKTIDELQSSDSSNQLSARRAERELREEKERALRLERELEGWKGRAAGGRRGLGMGATVSGGSEFGEENGVEIPTRKSSLRREMSLSKGFL